MRKIYVGYMLVSRMACWVKGPALSEGGAVRSAHALTSLVDTRIVANINWVSIETDSLFIIP